MEANLRRVHGLQRPRHAPSMLHLPPLACSCFSGQTRLFSAPLSETASSPLLLSRPAARNVLAQRPSVQPLYRPSPWRRQKLEYIYIQNKYKQRRKGGKKYIIARAVKVEGTTSMRVSQIATEFQLPV